MGRHGDSREENRKENNTPEKVMALEDCIHSNDQWSAQFFGRYKRTFHLDFEARDVLLSSGLKLATASVSLHDVRGAS